MWRCLVASVLLLLAGSALPQPSPPSTREELVRSIEHYAAEDAAAGLPMNDERALRVFTDRFGLTPYQVSQLYRNKYREVAAVVRPWWKRLPPWVPWLVAVLALIFRPMKAWLEDRLKKSYEELYLRYAWAKPFRRRALERYSESLLRNYQSFKIPFRDTPLEMRQVYVPLKVSDASRAVAAVEAIEAIRRNARLMITGNPGSGKSMLLRSLLLAYADGQLTGIVNDVVPVLIELGRLSDTSRTLLQEIAASFDRHGFPKAEPFVEHALARKGLLLLLDGLDEVNAKERQRVVTAVQDLIRKYDCRAIVTCRTQVYKGELSANTDRTLEVAEFKDQEILRLLKAWEPWMRPDQSIEQLMQILRERPRILLMARNPLLLTMIAYLYADQQITLPHSRAEFYKLSTSLLLERWAGDFNRFGETGAPAKRAVLSSVALGLQDKPLEDEDRRTVSLLEILKTTAEVLPLCNIKAENATEVLNEIVERNGLLLRIDGGTKYQFAHLTLQEYFAATALESDRARLVEKFRKDGDTWREVVMLWCGIARDATEMIRDLEQIEPVTALECVADARMVDPEVAASVIDNMKSRLRADPDAMTQPLLTAFGLVAASPGPRGEAMLDWLACELDAREPVYRGAVATSLSRSNSSKAALILAKHPSAEAQVALELMGDVAVRVLVSRGAADALVRIGTPRALEGAVSLLWNPNREFCKAAALALAPKLRPKSLPRPAEWMAHPADLTDIVEELTPAEREAIFETIDSEVAADHLSEADPKMQASILELLEPEEAANIVEEMTPDEAADLLREMEEESPKELLEETDTGEKTATASRSPGPAELREVELRSSATRSSAKFQWVWQPFQEPASSPVPGIAARVAEVLCGMETFDNAGQLDPSLAIPLYLATRNRQFLPGTLDAALRDRESKIRPAVLEDWVALFRAEYAFARSSLCKLMLLLGIGLAFVGTASTLAICLTDGIWHWRTLLLVSELFGALAVTQEIKNHARAALAALASPVMAIIFLRERHRTSPAATAINFARYFLSACASPLWLYFSSLALLRIAPLWTVLAMWSSIYAFAGISRVFGHRKERLAKNPLRGLLT
jgi:hypothetical protein